MAMDFWQKQAEARRNTSWLVFMFILMVLMISAAAEATGRAFAIPFLGPVFLLMILLVGLFNYLMVRSQGGSHVAHAVGAREVSRDTKDPTEMMLLNIVDEMAIASSIPVPPVFIIPAQEINAFAAGFTIEKAAVAITEGALVKLNRDEIQAVIAHEFGHVHNGDMRLNMRLSIMLTGFFVVMYIGFRVLQVAGRFKGGGGKKDNSQAVILIASLILIAAGFLTWIGGLVLRACISRQREFHADACSVQFTRHPEGLLTALQKIGADGKGDMPKSGGAYAHMYFNFGSGIGSIFATHPPLQKRIEAIQGHKYMPPEREDS